MMRLQFHAKPYPCHFLTDIYSYWTNIISFDKGLLAQGHVWAMGSLGSLHSGFSSNYLRKNETLPTYTDLVWFHNFSAISSWQLRGWGPRCDLSHEPSPTQLWNPRTLKHQGSDSSSTGRKKNNNNKKPGRLPKTCFLTLAIGHPTLFSKKTSIWHAVRRGRVLYNVYSSIEQVKRPAFQVSVCPPPYPRLPFMHNPSFLLD